MPNTNELLENPVIWVIFAMTVVCYYNLFCQLFSASPNKGSSLTALSLDNTQILLSSLPLLGLLGTIVGLLQTFAAMAQGVGNQAELMSAGIADAMYTTELGLLMVIPGWLMLYQRRRALQNEYIVKTLAESQVSH